jgi:hypothetical protein
MCSWVVCGLLWWCVACCMLCLPPQHLYFRGLVAVEVCALGFRLVSHTQGTCLIPSSSPPHSPLVPSRYFLGSCHLWDSDTDMGCTHLVPAEIMLKLTSAIKASICTHTTCICSHAAESAQATWHVIILVCHPSACSYTPSLSALPLPVCLSICLPCPWLVCLTDLTQVAPSLLSLLAWVAPAAHRRANPFVSTSSYQCTQRALPPVPVGRRSCTARHSRAR